MKLPALAEDVSRRFVVRSLCVAGAYGAFPTTRAAAQTSTERPATHNMLVFGQKTLYLSHLPMFDKLNSRKDAYVTPHRFQVILEASLTAAEGDPEQIYVEDRRTHPNVRMYTLQPDPFVLATLFPDGATPPVRQFPAGAVFRGHLERQGNSRILSNCSVVVRQVIYAHPFAVTEKRPAKLEYLVFGKADELFAVHLIAAPPDFDQILPVRLNGGAVSPEELARGIRVSIPGRKNLATARLTGQSGVPAQATIGGKAVAVKLDAGREVYFEEGELSIPPRFHQTAEEKRAGFTEEMT